MIEGWALRDLGAGAALSTALERIGLPCIVKPSRSGSALGVSAVEREADLAGAVMGALSFSDAAIVERMIRGTEIAAGFVGTPMEALPLVEIVPKDGVYDYGARYTAGATEYYVPARLDAASRDPSATWARTAIEALGTRGFGRVDVLVTPEGSPSVLEVNVSPGMTETSLLPMAAHAAGISFEQLCDRIIQSTLLR